MLREQLVMHLYECDAFAMHMVPQGAIRARKSGLQTKLARGGSASH